MFTLSAYEIAGGYVDVGCDRASGARGQRRWLSERVRDALLAYGIVRRDCVFDIA